ncbi:MAG: phosphoribosylanthranilate isomerase [Nitrospirae bacterium]|nr:phosphoribosylanthranilate isomerase [Nitrospirota bacterium]
MVPAQPATDPDRVAAAPVSSGGLKVKICGITNAKDAEKSIEAGADALGFIFYENSPRSIKPEKAREIIEVLPPFIATVGVFVDVPEAQVRKVKSMTGIRLFQFHGQEPPSFCERFRPHAIKALRMQGAQWYEALRMYHVSGFLLDGYAAEGESSPQDRRQWVQAKSAAEKWRVILAGGLGPGNVAHAVQLVRPYGVDVARGVEVKPGMKDWVKVRDFIQSARGA